jgi:drug/metabolite transporter (DMT)-like permease
MRVASLRDTRFQQNTFSGYNLTVMQNVIILIIISAFACGSIAPFAKFALEGFQPFTLIFVRFLSASLVLLPFFYKSKELKSKLNRPLLVVSIIGSLNPIILFIALQFTLASVSPLIHASIPLLTAIYLHQFKKVKISPGKLIGIVLGFCGVAIIILLPFFQQGDLDLPSLWGNMLIFGAAIAFMFYGILSKDIQQQYHLSPLELTFYLCVVTLIISIPFVIYEISQEQVITQTIQFKHLLAALVTGIIGTSLFYIVYHQALKLGNALTASLFTYLQPVTTILFAVLLLGEVITLPFVIGGTLAMLGAGMASVKKNNSSLKA